MMRSTGWRRSFDALLALAGLSLVAAAPPLAAQDSVTVVVTWQVIFASNQDAVLSYDLEARSSTLQSAVQDFSNPDGGDRVVVARDTVSSTTSQTFSHSFQVPRPACCSPLYVGVRLRGMHLGLDGPWTNPNYPTVAIDDTPLTIPQVFPQVDTLRTSGPPPPDEFASVALVDIRIPSVEIAVGMPPSEVNDFVYVDMGDQSDPDPNGNPWPDGRGAPYPHLHEAVLNEPVDCSQQIWRLDGEASSTHDCNWLYWQGNTCAGDYGCILDYCGEDDFQCEVALGA